jgi:putative sterol carrier protein
MAVTFLTEEWTASVKDALNGHDGFKSAAANVTLGMQFTVTDVPDAGEVKYFLKIDGGAADVALGETEGPDVGISSNYETAASISKGELNTQTAFMTGKLKVTGNLAKLMMHQNVIAQWGAATTDLEVDY